MRQVICLLLFFVTFAFYSLYSTVIHPAQSPRALHHQSVTL